MLSVKMLVFLTEERMGHQMVALMADLMADLDKNSVARMES
jgi:hypothetical protein